MKQFIKNNQTFICDYCNKVVPQHPTSSRDHCCFCLYSKHVDINPGDRQNGCKGLLMPVGIRTANGKTQIAYNCTKCSERVFNITAEDDSKTALQELYSKVWN